MQTSKSVLGSHACFTALVAGFWLSLCHHHLDKLLVIDLAIAVDICLPNHLIHLQRQSRKVSALEVPNASPDSARQTAHNHAMLNRL